MNWQKLSIAAYLSSAIAVFPIPSALAGSANLTKTQVVAQTVSECRLVNVNSGWLNVRSSPSVYGQIVGVLADGADIAIASPGRNGWVPITRPFSGFVAAKYLALCGSVGGPADAVIPANCREVNASGGLRVRQKPSIDSPIVGVLANNRTINIGDNRSTGIWVPVQVPLKGYVYGSYLNYCSPSPG